MATGVNYKTIVIMVFKYRKGGPYGSSSMEFGINPHSSREYIKPEYINKLDAIARDARGHLPDYVKGVDHPSGQTYGKFINNNVFEINDPSAINYVRPGLDDNGDYKTRVVYNNSSVLPAITVTPSGNYVEDEYNNIKFRYRFGGKYKRIAFDFYKDKFNKR